MMAPLRILGVGGLVPLVLSGAVVAQDAAQLDLSRFAAPDAEARRISVTLARGVRSAQDLRSPALLETRRRLHRGQPVSLSALRALADAGDGNAALRLVRRLADEGRKARPENLAHYYGMAAATGRVGGLYGLARILPDIDPEAAGAARLAVLKRTLLAYAIAGNSVASEALLAAHRTGIPFGPLDDDLIALLTEGRGAGRAAIALQLAGETMNTGWDHPAPLTEALSLLRIAAADGSFQTKLMAQNMMPLVSARLDEIAPQASVEDDG